MNIENQIRKSINITIAPLRNFGVIARTHFVFENRSVGKSRKGYTVDALTQKDDEGRSSLR